jgi:ArsR family transcriptional regulator
MLKAAKKRLAEHKNVDLRSGALEALPISSGSLDAAMMFLVLHHVAEPARAISEAARTLKAGGRLIVVDMLPHDRDEYRPQMGHLWLGFAEDAIARTLSGAGFDHVRMSSLPTDPKAKGPALFAARAVKPAAGQRLTQPAVRRSR